MTNSRMHGHMTTNRDVGVPDTIGGIDKLSGRDFEFVAAELLEAQGYRIIQVTPASGDFGTDIVAEYQGIRYSVQVKCQSSWVNPDAVREALRGRATYGCAKAMVITNRTFMRYTKTLARQEDCRLVGRDELSKWVESYAVQSAVRAALRELRQMKHSTTAAPSSFRVGDRVKHSVQGEGYVVSVEQAGKVQLLSVAFDRAGRKRMSTANERLEKV